MSLNFPLEKKTKKLAFTAVCSDLEASLSRVTGALGSSGSSTKSYFLASDGKRLCIVAFSQDTFCAVVVPNATVDHAGSFGIDAATFQGIIKGRSTMEFEFSGTDLSFKLSKGKYNGKITVLPVQDDAVAYSTAHFGNAVSGGSPLSRQFLSLLKEGVAATAVKDVYSKTDLMAHIIVEEKSLRVSAYDRHHFALYRAKLKDGVPMRLVMPTSHFAVIDRLAGDEKDVTFHARPEALRVSGKNFLLVLPSSQAADGDFTAVSDFLKAKGDMVHQFGYKTADLITLVDNLFTLNAQSSAFDIEPAKSGLQFTFSTPNGRASDTLRAVRHAGKEGKAVKVRVEPTLLRDLMSLTKPYEEAMLGFTPGSVLSITCTLEGGGKLVLASALVN